MSRGITNTHLSGVPDWHTQGAVRAVEQYIGNGWKYRGPGLYLSDTDTLLVIEQRPIGTKPYTGKKPRRILVLVWNCELRETILGWTPPTVVDTRGDA